MQSIRNEQEAPQARNAARAALSGVWRARWARGLAALAIAATAGWGLAWPSGAARAADAAAAPPPASLAGQRFYWGVTTAGYQNDGPVPGMDWYQLETAGKVPDKCGRGPDFRAHMDEDLDRAASLGLNAFRTSLEWARLEVAPGVYDPAEVAYVHRLLSGLRRRGMTPIITLHHFVTPRWVYDLDHEGLVGWESPRTVEAFERFVAFVAREFGAEIDTYLTFNEPSTMILGGYFSGVLYPHRWGPVSASRVIANILDGHQRAYAVLHRLDPGCAVSLPDYNCLMPPGVPYRPGEWLARALPTTRSWDGVVRPASLDFVALHYYGTNWAPLAFPIEPHRWEANPADFEATLKAYHEAFHLPILVAENGCAMADGSPRPDGVSRERFLVEHVAAIQRARAAGVPVIGYMHWTLTDSYEWGTYTPRFGLWSVDVRSGDLTRRETPAVAVYREIVRNGGVGEALWRRYAAGERAARML